MTMINVNSLVGRFNLEQRRKLAEKLTDVVMIEEIGQFVAEARVGFQVIFTERDSSYMAVSGKLLSDISDQPDNININILVMDGCWTKEIRSRVIKKVLYAMADVCGIDVPPNSWKVTFQIIEEGSWGTGKGVLSILDLLNLGVFTPQRIEEIRENLSNS